MLLFMLVLSGCTFLQSKEPPTPEPKEEANPAEIPMPPAGEEAGNSEAQPQVPF